MMLLNGLLPDDVIYHILLWLCVKSLIRFKTVGKSWRGVIESSGFIEEHLHYHHHDRPCLKNDNHNLIFWFELYHPPLIFPITCVHNFDAPNRYLQLDFPSLHKYFPAYTGVAIFNGIVCLHFQKQSNSSDHAICLWNPATRKHRLLPESPFQSTIGVVNYSIPIVVGFGFDDKTNDYKVVKVIKSHGKKRVEVYSLRRDSWTSIDTLVPIDHFYTGDHPKMPFQNGTRFCWNGVGFGAFFIFCFDFISETFRSISYPKTNHSLPTTKKLYIVHDKIACVLTFSASFYEVFDWEYGPYKKTEYWEIWVFNDYGSVDESWTKLYCVDDPCHKIHRSMLSIWISTDGNYLFIGRIKICRYNLVTEELKQISRSEFNQSLQDGCLPKFVYFHYQSVAEFKESLVSIEGGNETPIQSQ